MRIKSRHIILNLVTAFAVTLFFSCGNNTEAIQKFNQRSEGPSAEGEGVLLKYTDSGRLAANLVSPKMYDYSNLSFSYSEFPDGMVLYLYDKQNQQTTIISDYAIVYNDTDLIDLRGNVIAATPELDTLYADQLYYDQTKQWLFTNLPVTFRSKDYVTNGEGFDSDRDFTKAEVLGVTGQFAVTE